MPSKATLKRKYLRRFKGEKVFREGRNDGLFVYLKTGEWDGRPYRNIHIAPFYEIDEKDKDGENLINWQHIAVKSHDGGKTWMQYSTVKIDQDRALALCEAIMKVVGLDPNIAKAYDITKKEKEPEDYSDIGF